MIRRPPDDVSTEIDFFSVHDPFDADVPEIEEFFPLRRPSIGGIISFPVPSALYREVVTSKRRGSPFTSIQGCYEEGKILLPPGEDFSYYFFSP